MISGTDTVATFLEWCILYMIKYPEIQELLYNDIEQHVGISGSIALSDRSKLPYVEAFIDEVSRHSPEATMGGPPHKTMQDVILRGQFIPKGTQVNIAVCYNFNRFLTEVFFFISGHSLWWSIPQ